MHRNLIIKSSPSIAETGVSLRERRTSVAAARQRYAEYQRQSSFASVGERRKA